MKMMRFIRGGLLVASFALSGCFGDGTSGVVTMLNGDKVQQGTTTNGGHSSIVTDIYRGPKKKLVYRDVSVVPTVGGQMAVAATGAILSAGITGYAAYKSATARTCTSSYGCGNNFLIGGNALANSKSAAAAGVSSQTTITTPCPTCSLVN